MGIIINGQNDTIGPVDNSMSLLGTVSIGGTMTIEDFTNIQFAVARVVTAISIFQMQLLGQENTPDTSNIGTVTMQSLLAILQLSDFVYIQTVNFHLAQQLLQQQNILLILLEQMKLLVLKALILEHILPLKIAVQLV